MARIILVEDDPDTGETVRAMLELMGHAVQWARSGREALGLFREAKKGDLVLTDIVMPDMDGIETIQYLRRTYPELPIIAMTAHQHAPYLRAATLFGVKATLHKPFRLEALEKAIQQAMQP